MRTVAVIIFLSVLLGWSCVSVPLRAEESMAGREMLAAAEARVHDADPEARLVEAVYSRGNDRMEFRDGEFVFNSPRLAGDQGGPNSLAVTIHDGRVGDPLPVARLWIDGPRPVFLPDKAYTAACSAGLSQWWGRHPSGYLTMRLQPGSKNSGFDFGHRDVAWFWTVQGADPVVDSDFGLWLDADTLKVLAVEVERSEPGSAVQDQQDQMNRILHTLPAPMN